MYFALSDRQDFLEDHVSVVSATRVGNGGASANVINRSQCEEIANVALGLINSIILHCTCSPVVFLKHYVNKSLISEEFRGSDVPARLESMWAPPSGALSNKVELFSKPSFSLESGTSMIYRWSVLTDRFGLL